MTMVQQTSEHLGSKHENGVQRLHRRSREMQERSIELREWSTDLPGPARMAMRRRAAELELHAVALTLAADGVEASHQSPLAAAG